MGNKLLSRQILDNFNDFIDYFDLDLRETNKGFTGTCPIHEGADNFGAFILYKNSGLWFCNTHGCHNHSPKGPLGLIECLLANSGKDVDVFLAEFFTKRPPKPPTRNVSRATTTKKDTLKLEPAAFLKEIECPATYYLNRGFDAEILSRYYVGFYPKKYRQLSNRVLVPIFDDVGRYIVGCTGRSLYDKCLVCGGFHPAGTCIDKKTEPWNFQKWMNNEGFARSNHLYNYWFAASRAVRQKQVILVEGPSEVWKLEEAGITNSMAIFGSSMNNQQAELIRKLDIPNVLTLMDSDGGGQEAELSVNNQLRGLRIKNCSPPKKDLGEMDKKEILEFIWDL